MKTNRVGKLFLFAALVVPLVATAQDGPGNCPGKGHMCGARHSRFDPKAVTTVQGEIADIQRFEGRRRHGGIVLTVTVGSEALPVHLGPDFYLEKQSLKLAKGDKIEVKGARIELRGKPVMIAQEVRRGDEVLTLRDADGIPLWRGQGHEQK